MPPLVQIHETVSRFADQRWYGRLYSPDPRDRLHTMGDRLYLMSRAALKIRTQAPQKGPTLDQGPTSRCVMFSAATSLGALPIGYGRTAVSVLATVQQPVAEDDGSFISPDLYSWAQRHDEWPGEDYDGTSVRAGQEYLRKIGRSIGYVWATNLDETKDYIKRMGSAPIILGIDWLEKMDTPIRIHGAYYIEADGPVLGGHAICCLWYDRVRAAWKLQNTWGSDWGDNG